mmetsp:Transcript_33707/g.77832  ORF Transcript_33707/g.77832 Transcript_33707/m.77832 type:complete len:277 (+) Transcript_33707:57-887(+)
MAERTCLTVPAGQRLLHKIPCFWEEDGGDGKMRSVALGSLEWNAIVLGEKTVDLEISVLLKPEEGGSEPPTMHWLQQKGSGRTFQGCFTPGDDSRFVREGGGLVELDEVIFEFDNSYSWWTDKEVELITIRSRSEQNPPPLPLPVMSPLSLPPRAADRGSGGEAAAKEVPELRKANALVADADAGGAFRFISQLEAFLSAAEAQCPKEGLQIPGAEGLLEGVLQLRKSCKDILHLVELEKKELEKKLGQGDIAGQDGPKTVQTSPEAIVEGAGEVI